MYLLTYLFIAWGLSLALSEDCFSKLDFIMIPKL